MKLIAILALTLVACGSSTSPTDGEVASQASASSCFCGGRIVACYDCPPYHSAPAGTPSNIHQWLSMQQTPPDTYNGQPTQVPQMWKFVYAEMTVPPVPPTGGDHEVGYWASIHSFDGTFIVQPFIQFGSRWDCQPHPSDGWYMMAYALDNRTTASCGSGAVAVNPGDLITFQITLLSTDGADDTWGLSAEDVNSRVFVSNTHVAPRVPNMLDFSQEWLNVSCDGTPSATLNYISALSGPADATIASAASAMSFSKVIIDDGTCGRDISADLQFGIPTLAEVWWTL
jgi:hypothetical protein